jgi:hypothetical protein
MSRLRQAGFAGPLSQPAISQQALDAACAHIFQRWHRFVSAGEALEQAQNFAARFEPLAVHHFHTEVELEAALEAVADAMGES